MWNEEYCPECHYKNWVNLGDLDDLTAQDVEGVECYKCKHKWVLGDGEALDTLIDYYFYNRKDEFSNMEREEIEKEIINDINVVKGLKKPN